MRRSFAALPRGGAITAGCRAAHGAELRASGGARVAFFPAAESAVRAGERCGDTRGFSVVNLSRCEDSALGTCYSSLSLHVAVL